MKARAAPFLIPLVVSLLGAAIAHRHGVSWLAFAPNVAVSLSAVALVPLLRHIAPGRLARAASALTAFSLALLLATLVAPGQSGVHRWLALGPMRLNASAAFMPFIVFGIALLVAQRRWAAVSLLAAVQSLHALQPDRGQAVALAASALALGLVAKRTPPAQRIALPLVGVVGVALSWRSVELPPVEYVECILELALETSALVLVVAVVALSAVVAPLWLWTKRALPQHRIVLTALAAYVTGAVLAGLTGPFPIPVLGAGAGPVAGTYTAFALAFVIAAP